MFRTSPLIMAFIYFVMGVLFTILAIGSVEDTIWNFSTVLLMLVATFDFGVSIRLFLLNNKIKKMVKK